MTSFSAKNRSSIISEMSTSSFDLIVIGGGITGAGIALDASARGMKVALIEMQDFAAGTSSRSTKLIHGGLRYLKQLEFKLVAEVGKERAIVHQNAPHLTKPEHLLLPIVEGGSLTKFTARLGMTIYEWLAGVKKEEKHRVLNREETIAAEPLLRRDNLLGGILFYEYRTDDARLTIEIIKEAVSKGAVAINYMKAVSFLYTDSKISGVKVCDQLNNKTVDLQAKYFVNATGPWVDEIDDLDKPQNQHKLHITKGIHIVVNGQKLPLKQSSYFDTYDKRMIFVIPREGKTYIGTTDTFYSGDVANPLVTADDVTYLLKCVNDIFPSIQLTASDIESTWAGLRPLIQKPGKGPSEISRKDEIFESTSGLITIAGGKLTGYRKMAQRIVDLIAKKIKLTGGKNIPNCTTENIELSGGKVGGAVKFSDFVKNKIILGKELGLTITEAEMLLNRYGSNIDSLYNIIEKLKKQEQDPLPLLLRAQLHYCIENEMCTTPSDFFIRRIGALYFDIETVKIWETPLLLYMKKLLNWDDHLTAKFDAELQKAGQQISIPV
ncbi:MAG: FAD-dependent oxidoreductase [Bacteroidota bacterium]